MHLYIEQDNGIYGFTSCIWRGTLTNSAAKFPCMHISSEQIVPSVLLTHSFIVPVPEIYLLLVTYTTVCNQCSVHAYVVSCIKFFVSIYIYYIYIYIYHLTVFACQYRLQHLISMLKMSNFYIVYLFLYIYNLYYGILHISCIDAKLLCIINSIFMLKYYRFNNMGHLMYYNIT